MIIINKINEYFRKRHNLDNFKLPSIYLINDSITLIGWWIYKRWEKGEVIWWDWKFNLKNPVEKQLSRINRFNEVLGSIYNDRLQILYDSVYYDEEERVKEAKKIWEESGGKVYKILLDWSWDGMEQSAYVIFYDYEEEKIYYNYCDIDMKEEDEIHWTITKEEFNLLMQIYFWVYDEAKIRKELEEKEKKWEYEGIESLIDKEKFIKENRERIDEYNEKLAEEMRKKQSRFYSRYTSIDKEFNKIISSKPEVQEYLKLQLLRKHTEWAFPELNIKKIYDKNWDEEEQKKVVEKINKELCDEVVILKKK